jgi:hypothetical protein
MRKPMRPENYAQPSAFCRAGRGMVYATLNKRLHRPSRDWMDYANDRGKLL